MLEQQGLVEMKPGRLTRITPATAEDADRVYAVLAALQALAAELGTPNADATDIEELRKYNARLLAAVEAKRPVRAREADRMFHDVLVRLADNVYLTSSIEPLLIHIRRLEALYFAGVNLGRQSHEDHEQIIAAVVAGDAVAARETTRHNFQRYWTPARTEPSGRGALKSTD